MDKGEQPQLYEKWMRKHWDKKIKVLPGFEPGTFCVLGRCDNHYTTLTYTSPRSYETRHVI